jgi:hypothetical protein
MEAPIKKSTEIRSPRNYLKDSDYNHKKSISMINYIIQINSSNLQQ